MSDSGGDRQARAVIAGDDRQARAVIAFVIRPLEDRDNHCIWRRSLLLDICHL